jgi:hypothetical protein
VSEIRDYLQALQRALAGSDPALVQDALSEAEALYRRECQRLSWAEPLLSEAEVRARSLASLGSPEDRAGSNVTRDRVVAEALAPVPAAEPAPEHPWPSFLGVLAAPKAYTSVLYILAAYPISIFYFVWGLTGLCLSLGLCVLIIGVPFLVLYLGSARALGLGEGRLVEALLDVRMPRRPPLLPEGSGWFERLKGIIVDSHTWKCVAYLLLHMPVTLVTFLLTLVGLGVSLGLLAVPIAHGIFHTPVLISCWEGDALEIPFWLQVIFPVGGFLGFIGTLHMALGLGRLHGSLARALLVRH